MTHCSETLTRLSINDNKSINRAVPDLINCLTHCTKLEYLNISDLRLKKKFAGELANSLLQSIQNGSKLETLMWNYDLTCSNSTALRFLNSLAEIEHSSLKEVQMLGVVQLKTNRSNIERKFKNSHIKLELFQPNYTDDELDNSEDPSQDSEGSTHSSRNSDHNKNDRSGSD